jgi:dTDP-glucose 4,6-dehydratase
MRVMITGIAGFIGSHLARAHVDSGDHVFGVDNFSTGSRINIDKIPNLQIIESGVTEALGDFPQDLDIVYHFASPASPEKYMEMAMNTMEVNTVGTLGLLQYCQRTGARLIFASTSEIYGDPQVSPQSEEYWGNVNPIGPRSVYDEAKRFGETLVSHFRRTHGVKTGIIRIFNTYGPNMDPFDGRVVSTFIRQALNGEPFTIYGDGTQTRSFCYIEDLVRGIQKMGESDNPGPINLGNPTEHTLLELAQIVGSVVGRNLGIILKPLPEDDPRHRNPDVSRAREVLGWEPVISLEEGVSRTADWMRASA